MTDETLSLTPRQLEAVWSWMIHGNINRRADGTWSRGNALRRMQDRLEEADAWGKYDRYDKDKPAIFTSGPLIPALRAFLADPRAASLFSHPKSEELREKIEKRIADLEKTHAEWSEQLTRRQAQEREAAQLRNATDRANRIGRHRDNLRELGARFNIKELSMFADSDDDDVILAFATAVCDAEFSA